MSTMRPSKPASRAASAALAPVRLAPMIASVGVVLMAGCCCSRRGDRVVSRPHAGEGEELGAGPVVEPEEPVEGGGDGAGPLGSYAAQGHAEVLGLHHDANALGVELVLQPVGDLLGEPLLDLQAAGEQLDHPGEL